MYKYVVESRAPQSTTQHSSAITPAQRSKQPSTCRSEYVSKVCSYMHASRLFSWSMELLAVASRRFARKILGRLLTTSLCQFNPFFLASERSGRKPPATRSALVHTKKRPSSHSPSQKTFQTASTTVVHTDINTVGTRRSSLAAFLRKTTNSDVGRQQNHCLSGNATQNRTLVYFMLQTKNTASQRHCAYQCVTTSCKAIDTIKTRRGVAATKPVK